MTSTSLHIRFMNQDDIDLMVKQFAAHNWQKPRSTFIHYLQEQENQERLVWLAFYENYFAGYITLKWDSFYPSFKQQHIPEIMDLNVLPPYRNKGIASALLDLAEAEGFKNHSILGIGVGLYADYGQAQRLYVQRGYIPDGMGITYAYKTVEPGSVVCLDDDLILWFTKRSS
ncbi:GNAT family acetyltransferase [Legionella steigerwaltii]|uniref:GNAT family acetyltransferase n=1 Tax=Legionella steigerwaltii TaxID=460 RepID=A0A378LDW8_9GAMM|nr:GNAT family N-acetyltransferase [Legionella steigerwaltii]KTD79545.1 GNAT family acetyltransferase [Legionella steigerwaltii]STY24570.1 GNAT family acetyltransferase [Legionella steigerwaltii]